MPRRPSSSRSLRIVLDNRALPDYIRSLSPAGLAQICSRIGIADAAEVMALAPANQLIKALETSVWKTPRPGLAEIFDPRELMEWLAAWLDIGEEFTAERLCAIPEADLTLYLSHVVHVATGDMWGFERSTEIEDLERIYAPSYHENAYGPYVVDAVSSADWEILRAALDALWSHSPERLLRLFGLLSADESMLAPEAQRESSNQDFRAERDDARERQGQVSAAGAQGFLAVASTTPLQDLFALSEYDTETRRHLAGIAGDPLEQHAGDPSPERAGELDFTALHEELVAAGWVETVAERPLLPRNARGVQLPLIEALSRLAEQSPVVFDARSRELAYLGNVLIAGVASNNERLNSNAARDAALATCNLGLELLRSHGVEVCIDGEPGLIRLFLVGWQALGRIPARAVDALSRSLARVQTEALLAGQQWMLDEASSNLADVRAAFAKRDFGAAREAALLLSFVLESQACRAILPLLDEFPRMQSTDERGEVRWIESLADLRIVATLFKRLVKTRVG